MLLKNYVEGLPGKTYIMLGLIVLILAGGIVASMIYTKRHGRETNG